MLGKILNLLGNDKSPAQPPSPTASPTGAQAADQCIEQGNRAEQAGQFKAACEHYREAVRIAPQYGAAHLNLGIGLEALGEIEQARAAFETALSLDPDDVFANYNLGRQLFSRGSIAEAEPLLRQAIRGNPDFADARVVLARLLDHRGELDGAVEELEQALRIVPDYFGALCNYADVLVKLQRIDEALAALRKAAAAQPGDFETHYKLGHLLFERNQLADAKRHFLAALGSKPGSMETHASLVNVCLALGDLAQAASHAEAALKSKPDWLDLLFDYGLILKRMARTAEAEAAFRRAITLDKRYVGAYQMLGSVLLTQGRVEEALAVFHEGRTHCEDAFALESPEMFALNCKDDISIEDLFARHVDYGKRLQQLHPARFAPFANTPDPNRRLRIGYVSGDLQHHVVAQFLLPLLEERDRTAVEVICYSTGDTDDKMSARLRGLCDIWRNASRMPPGAVADLVHQDRIDILVDLAGHSGTPNLAVFAQQPAPVQATWVGYLNTTGLTRIQYRISDQYCDPPGLTERFHTEKLVRLPHSQWCYRPFVDVECAPEAAYVRNGFVTFGSFNQTVKITPSMRELWGRILTQIPDARLLVVGVVDQQAQSGLYRDLGNAGVDRARIRMMPYVPLEEYYRSFGKVDIALDTMPFSGGTTTCDALWMGTPVITAPGSRSWSRSAASVLTTLRLQDWIAETPEDYVQRAVRFARNLPAVGELRKSLRSNMLASPLMNRPQFTRDMEQAFRQMWQSWCSQNRG